MSIVFLRLAAAYAFMGVAMGAFGAHGLKEVVTPELLDVYKTAVNYQMWHALGLGLIAQLLRQNIHLAFITLAGWLMAAGIVLFSGSLYLLVALDAPWMGVITPFGGLAFLAAWGLVFYSLMESHEC